jgi:anaerobic magnesium-protoporphyrin IX monomethyl ester cyclase
MRDRPVFFVAFLEQDNLGVGYIGSVLLQNEIDIKITDFRAGKRSILQQIMHHNPLIIGFSIIFQYHIDDFRDLISYLRKHGVNCHFCAGGHYPSLRYAKLLEMIPGLDSVVLFEGEYTLLELAQSIYSGKEWKQIEGIAYRDNGSVTANPLRPLEENLDNFPAPVRQPLKEYALGKKYATLLAGRGCYYNCSFCSIREFYSKPKGPVKRVRRPEIVAREIELLYQQKDCTVFMFQDDDFPVTTQRGKEWTARFCDLLAEKGLSDKILWKINCRPDEIDAELFRLMRDSGLFLVYLGIEHGTDDGLRLMNKRMTVDTNIRAVNTLKKLGIPYDFGFMLFHPATTYQSVAENLDFLVRICGDGSSPITFCKMLPYAETRIEHELRSEGRLKGKPGFEDYDFLDASLDRFYSFMTVCFGDWIGKHEGLLNTARWTRYYSLVYRKYYPLTSEFRDLNRGADQCIARSNMFFIDATRTLVDLFSSQHHGGHGSKALTTIKSDVAAKHSQYRRELVEIMRSIDTLVHAKQ